MRIFSIVPLLAAVILLAGCKSPPHSAAPYAAAAVEVADVDELECNVAVRKVFIRNGYNARGGSGREYKYDRVAGTGDQLIFGSFLGGGGITYRVKINLIGLEARRYVIAATPQIVRDAGDATMEEEQRTSRGRKELQKMLEEVKAELGGAPAPVAK